MDLMALNNLISQSTNCSELVSANINLADKIYSEAYLLEKYEDAGKVTEGLKIAHEKYDALRTFLWINTMKTLQQCPGKFNAVVYLYEYNTQDLAKKAEQNVWSKIIYDLKQKEGNRVILIPIAVNSNLASLDYFTNKLNVTNYPVVIINDRFVVTKIDSVKDLEVYLDK